MNPFVFVIVIVGIIGLVTLKAVRMIVDRDTGPKGDKTATDDVALIQEIHRGLMKMEDRVEALETLLMDKDRKGGAQ